MHSWQKEHELCEDTLKQLEDPANHDEDTIDNVFLQLAELETLVQQAAEAHTHAWGHPAEEDQDVAKAAHLLREEHQSDVIRQNGGYQLSACWACSNYRYEPCVPYVSLNPSW